MGTPNGSNQQKRSVDRTALYGCLGTVLAAVISGFFLLASSGILQIDLGPIRLGKTSTPTAEPAFQPTVSPESAATFIPTVPAQVTDAPVPSDTDTPEAQNTATTNVLGQTWEENDVSLTLTSIDVHATSDQGTGAVQASFRFLNKSGQRLLVPIDWSKIHVEDSAGAIYTDWEGGGTTSVNIEPQRSYDFQRYYSLQPRDRSRIPSSTQYVDIVIEEFSRINGARWRYPVNADLAPMPTPDPQIAKAVGATWEQDGWTLTLTRLDIPAESDQGTGAAHAYFALANKTGARRLVDIDFNHIYMLDSFGQRYQDWQGGEIASQWLDPDKTWTFDRYYSLMLKARTRVPSKADFVLIVADKVAQLTNKQWRYDIVR